MATLVHPPAPASVPSAPPDSFPAWVRAERKKRGWTQRALAERASVGFSAVSGLELGHFNASPTLRARLAAVFAAAPVPDATEPPSDADAPPPVPTLDADSSALLRSQMIHAMLDRKLNQTELAHALGLKQTVIRNLIKDSRALIPQHLADSIIAWLRGDTPDPADGITHPAIPAAPSEAIAAPADLDAVEDQAAPAPAADEPGLDPRLMRLFTHINLHLPRPQSGDVALLALLDKFPDYDAMRTVGEKAQWFRYFESLARLALGSRDGEA